MPLKSAFTLPVSIACLLLVAMQLVAQERDPAALGILSRAIGNDPNLYKVSVRDFVANGNITMAGGQETKGAVTIHVRGTDQFRMDVQLPNESRSLIANKGNGTFNRTGSKTKSVPHLSHNQVLSFPLATLLSVTSNPRLSIAYKGLEEVDGRQVHTVDVVGCRLEGLNAQPIFKKVCATEIVIDAVTFQVVKIQDSAYDWPIRRTLKHELFFSDYRADSGVPIPFSIAEKIDGHPTWSINLTAVQLNQSLSDADFVGKP